MTDDAPGASAWKEHTSAFDRVRSIAVTLDEPRSADWIADEALVAGNTARDHLERLVEMNVLQAVAGDHAVLYRPDPLYTRLRALRDILDSRTRDDLLELRAELQEQVESWRDEYGVESAAELREQAGRAETSNETRTLREAASDWDIVTYRLGLVEDAIEHYSDYSGTTSAPA
jgi:predicted ArsR family transcriptional regulator